MLKRLSSRERIEQLTEEFEPRLRRAFLASIADIRDSIVLKIIIERLERGDINGAVDAFHLEPEAFARLELAIAEAYNSGGAATVDEFPRVTDPSGDRVVFHFGVRNMQAENWLRTHSAELVTEIVDDQREGIRKALSDGLAAGQNPRQTALDVVGRMVNGKRQGGVIGLTSHQAGYVANARAELVRLDASYFDRALRDKRFDSTVRAAIADGKPLTAEQIDRITGRYADGMRRLRGEMLARTETMTALAKSRDDAIRQQIDAGKVNPQDVTKVWRSAHDDRVRFSHRVLNGQEKPLDEAFVSPSGALLAYPGDPNAPISEIIGCRCWMEYRIDFIAPVVRRFNAERV